VNREAIEWLKAIALDEAIQGDGDGVEAVMRRVIDREVCFVGPAARSSLVEVLTAEATGLGLVDGLMRDPQVSEVMINGPSDVWVERRGVMELTDIRFGSMEALREAVDRLLGSVGRRADDMSPVADATLPDGSRVNVILPPLAIAGPVVTIRRFKPGGMGIPDLVESGTLTAELADLLSSAVIDGLNILISGATGSGKTTTLAALARCIPHEERIITIEDAAELDLQHPHVVRLETRPASPGGRGAVSMRDLVRNALRMRPDRIVVGEVRGPEALDMLDALSTGHRGSLSTVHADSPAGAVERLTALVLQAASGLPHAAVEQRISSAFQLLVHQERCSDGSRSVTRVAVFKAGCGVEVEDLFSVAEDGTGLWASEAGAATELILGLKRT